MDIKLRKTERYIVCDFCTTEIEKRHIQELKEIFYKNRNLIFGINLEKIKKIHSDFLNFLAKHQTAIFSLNNDLLTLLSATNSVKLTEVYLNENDFYAQKRQMAKRDFRIYN